jgi:5'-3' exonuclease
MARPLLLLDSAALYYRAFYSQPTSLTRADGVPVNAVRGFLDSVARFIRDTDARQVVACWDEDWRPAWRVGLIDSYKAHRVAAEGENTSSSASDSPESEPDELTPQVQMILECLDIVGIPVVGYPQHEADDALATVARSEPGPTVVVTGDRDLFALVNDKRGVSVLYTGRGPAQSITEAKVRELYDIDAAQYIDMAVLRGDPSDGLPGVKGIGPKTAAQLLAEFGSLDALREAAADESSSLKPRVRASLVEATAYLDVAPLVVTPVDTLPIPALNGAGTRPASVDTDRVAALGPAWNIATSLGRIAAVMAN